jgi:ubiquinone biosynthesis protein UbiJ
VTAVLPGSGAAAVALAAAANHLLAGETWARDKLAQHAGKAFTLASGLFVVELSVTADGAFQPVFSRAAESERHAASESIVLQLTLPISAIPLWLAAPERWGELIEHQGDAALAACLSDIGTTAPWLIERELGRLLGPIAGQRLARLGRAFLDFPAYAASRLAHSVASYATEDSGPLPTGAAARALALQISAVEGRTSALQALVHALDQKTNFTREFP